MPIIISRELGRTLLRVAWLAIVIGCALELLLLVVAAGVGTLNGLKPFLADLTQKISWSVIVCVGIALGQAAAKMREAMMGLLGFISAPAGFYAARAIHKGVTQAMGMAAQAQGGSAFALALLKAVEYGVFGLGLYWIQKKAWGVLAHVGMGFAVGAVFGAGTLAITGMHLPMPALISREINEIFFPIGCALVTYSTDVIKKNVASGTASSAASPQPAQAAGQTSGQ
jgi:hypothetical protein